MRSRIVVKGILAAGLIVGVQLALGQIPSAQQATPQVAPAADAPQAARGGGRGAVDPRVQQRTYTFADTNEQMPYALFVSSKVTRDKKSPLIVSLHGLGGDQNTMVRESLRSVELAEQGGYILVAPMGYNSGGWYGIPPGPPRGAGANAAARGRGRGAPRPVIGGTAITDAAKVREASEKDVMTVLAMVRKEFNVDERRIYLMGHSMGGAGTYYLGSKHGKEFAALAPIAPAAMGMTNDRTKVLQAIKDAGVPMLVSMGDADEAVPVANVRMWVDTMKELQMNYEYKEYPGVTHGPIMAASMADIYAFFARHSRPAR
ncbi:MAG TPA: prolyl oligopeptidase family serine peptidase [Vicinamibacterales bacterium]|nr:prolyl oligopeptidase family serine peptidase [Vicinamibacterales bacterium]